MEIKTGDLLLVANTHTLSKIISYFTKSKWTHAGVFCYLWGELYVIEAEKRGIQLTKWSDPKYASGHHPTKGLDLLQYTGEGSFKEKDIATLMLPMVGVKPYDFIGLFDQAIYQITGKWYGKTGGDATKRFYCSEFAAYVHNYFLHNIPNWWEISPAKLHEEPNYKITTIC